MVAFMIKTGFIKCKTVQIFTHVYTVVLASEMLSSPFVSPKLPCVGRHSEYCTVTVGARQSKLFFEKPSVELCRDILFLNRKQYRLVRGLLTGH
jgi:ABC-type sulfate transport system permease subunit